MAIIGGYGQVGSSVAAALVANGRPVVIAGRDRTKAVRTATRLGPLARAAAVDVSDPSAVRHLVAGASAAVMCVEHQNACVARACAAAATPFIDVSASLDILTSIEHLDPVVRSNGSACILSVGLAPGASNILARYAYSKVRDACSVELTLVFGTAGDHGADSRRWVVDGLATVDGERHAKRIDVIGDGRRRAHPFPFADQYTLTRSLGTPVTTRLAFESRAVTRTLFALRNARVFAVARRLRAQRIVEAVLGSVRFGGDAFVIQADATRPDGSGSGVALAGRGECHATGVVAARATELVLSGRVTPGVHHLDTLTDIELLKSHPDFELREHGWGPGSLQCR